MTLDTRNGTASVHRPAFFASEETVRVDLEDGYWVEVKRELSYGEENELEGAAFRLAGGMNQDGSPKVEITVRQHRALYLSLYVVDWNLTDSKGKAITLPFKLDQRIALFDNLSGRWARKVVNEIDKLRAEELANAVRLKDAGDGVVDADSSAVDPTSPGAADVPGTPSPLASGSAVSPTPSSSGIPNAW